MGVPDYGAITGLSGLAGAAGLNSFNAALASNLNNGLADYQVCVPEAYRPGFFPLLTSLLHRCPLKASHCCSVQGLSFVNSLGSITAPTASPISPNNAAGLPLSKQRLFVVVHKVSRDVTTPPSRVHGPSQNSRAWSQWAADAVRSPVVGYHCGSVQGVSEDAVARLFRRFPGMEYCDLKKDRATGRSKVWSSSSWMTLCWRAGG